MFDSIAPAARRTALGFAGLLIALVLVAAGCDDGSADNESATGEATPTATAVITPTSTPTPTPTPTPGIQARTFQALDSYRYEVTMVLASDVFSDELPQGLDLGDAEMEMTVTGVRVNPDREHTHTTARLGFLSFTIEAITIGDEQWTRDAGREWVRSSSTLPGGIPGNVDIRPASVFGDGWGEADVERLQFLFETHPYDVETVNGLAARHYTFTAEQFAALFEGDDPLGLGAEDLELTFDLWLSDAHGVPVRLLMVALSDEGSQAMRLELDVTDVNDPSLSVEPPDTP